MVVPLGTDGIGPGGVIHFLVSAAYAFSIDEYLSVDRPALAARFRVLHYEALPSLTQFPRGTYVLAGLDQLNAAQLALVTELHARLAATDGVRMLNHPARTLRRFDLLRTLHARGRNDFRAVRAGSSLAGLRYPVFLRGERSHNGAISPLLHSAREVERAIGLALVRGHPFDDLLVVEFCSTRCPDGLFRKYSAFIVGDRVQGRCLEHGAHWMLKFESARFTRPLVMEEHDYVFGNPHQRELAEIFAIAGVRYGRIDYSVKDGRVETWEINLNATIGRGFGPQGGVGPRELWPIRDETRECFFDRFKDAWEAVDRETDAGPPVAVTFRPETIEAASRPEPPRGRPLAWGQAMLRPFKRWLAPIAGPFLRMVGMATRLAQRSRG